MNKFISTTVSLVVSLWLAAAQAEPSDELIFAAIDFPPFSMQKEKDISGVGVDVIREITKQKKLKMKEISIPISRIDEITEKMQAFFPIMTRSEKREKQLEWVGKITDDSYCFLTLKDSPPVKSLDQARTLKAIGVNQGGSSEAAINKQGGFKNLDGASGSSANIRKLFAKRVEATWATHMTYAFTVKSEGHDPKEVVCTGEYAKHEYWIAASKNVPATTLDEYKKTFAELDKQGFIKKALSSY